MNSNHDLQERRTRILLMGIGFGALLGLVSSYLYTRGVEENEGPDAGVSTAQLLGVTLTVIGLVRQIAELGKPKKNDRDGK